MFPNDTLADKATSALQESCSLYGMLDTRIINELLLMGADINAFDARGYTPLMIAASIGATDKVDYLIACGACPGVRRREDGANAQALAAANGHAHIARRLMRAPVRHALHFNIASAHQPQRAAKTASRRNSLRIVR